MIEIISGGQTGVDRAALDAALASDIRCGGWCPRGRLAEDGSIPARYPLNELHGGYIRRTEQNVIDSDATLIIHFGPLSGGTARTLDFCRQQNKQCLLIDGEKKEPERAAAEIGSFLAEQQIVRLNVAGPRASGDRRAYPYTLQVMDRLIQKVKNK